MTPVTDLGSAEYLGFAGGLFPNGNNSPPFAYEQAGVALGATVQALDKDGGPSAVGQIVMISIGMSNTSREFSQFIRLAEARKNPNLLMIDAARDGAAATEIGLPSGDYWKHVDGQLHRFEASPAQVQVVWLKTALAHDARGFPKEARLLQRALRSITGILSTKFPRLKLVYVSSRIYGGYSETDLSPEPIAYESAFAVKWLIEERIELARQLRRRFRFSNPMLIDALDDRAWRTFGSAPNVAMLVHPGGRIALKQGWFEPQEMTRAVNTLLKNLASHR